MGRSKGWVIMIEPRMYVKKCFSDLVVKYGSIFGKDKTMTDKQIIIDGVNVVKCPHRKKEVTFMNVIKCYNYGACEGVNCLYKQLKAKEQECERTKERLESFQKDYSKLYQVVENKGYIKELDQLKADREEALKQLEFVRTLNTVKEAEIRKLSKTLADIKEIAKPYQRDIDKICGHCRRYDGCHACCIDDINCYQYKKPTTPACDKYCELKEFEINNIANQILQKISEVEDEN